jgi:hypothetical protein
MCSVLTVREEEIKSVLLKAQAVSDVFEGVYR